MSMAGRMIDGKYRILQPIDAGGMGSVFKADEASLGRTVAIKKINAELAGDADAIARFRQEAMALAQAANNNVATIYAFVMDQGEPFLVMEYVEGVDLHELIGKGALPLNVAAPLLCGILRGFTTVHNKGIVHRDIKPKNVIVSRAGDPKIIDFGIARMASRSGVTQYGQTLGTPVYMSPEQILGEKLDRRSDLYSLAVVFFEMLTGVPPFPEDGPITVQKAHLEKAPPSLSSKVKGLPGKLEGILEKGMAKRQEKRYQNAEEFLDALELALGAGVCNAKGPVLAYLDRFQKRAYLPDSANVPQPTEYEVETGQATRFAEKTSTRKGKPWWLWVLAGIVLLAGIGIATTIITAPYRQPLPKPPHAPAPPSLPVGMMQSSPGEPLPLGAGQPPSPATGVLPSSSSNTPGAAAKSDTARADKVAPAKVASGTGQSAVSKSAAAKQPAPVDPAQQKRIDALKALGEYKEEKKEDKQK